MFYRYIITVILIISILSSNAYAVWPSLLVNAARTVGAELALREAEKILAEAWNKYHGGGAPVPPQTPKKVGYRIKSERQAQWFRNRYGSNAWTVVGGLVAGYIFATATQDTIDQIVKDVNHLTGLIYSDGSFADPLKATYTPIREATPLPSVPEDGVIPPNEPTVKYRYAVDTIGEVPISEVMSMLELYYEFFLLEYDNYVVSTPQFIANPYTIKHYWIERTEYIYDENGNLIDIQKSNYRDVHKIDFVGRVNFGLSVNYLGARVVVYVNCDLYYDTKEQDFFEVEYINKVEGYKLPYLYQNVFYTIDYYNLAYNETFRYGVNNGFMLDGGLVYYGFGIDDLQNLAYNVFLDSIVVTDSGATGTMNDSYTETSTEYEHSVSWVLNYHIIPEPEYYYADVVAYEAVMSPEALATVEERTPEGVLPSQNAEEYDYILDLPDEAIHEIDPSYPIEDGSGQNEPAPVPVTDCEAELDALFASLDYPMIQQVSYDSYIDIPEQDNLIDYLDYYISNNPWSAAIRGSGIVVDNSVCRFEVNLYGNTVAIDFCNLDEFYSIFRVLIVGIFSLVALLIVFG